MALLTVGGRRAGARPGEWRAQAQRAVERLVARVAQCQRGHGAAAAAGAGSRRLSEQRRPPGKRASEALPRGPRFFPKFFSRGARAGPRRQWRAAAHRSRPPPAPARPHRPSPPPDFIYVPYIKRVFRGPLWIFHALYIRHPPPHHAPRAPANSILSHLSITKASFIISTCKLNYQSN